VASTTITGALAGSVTITASAGSLTSGTTTFTIVAGAADHLVFSTSAGGLASGHTRTLTVEIRDAGRNLVAADNSTAVTFEKTSGTGTVAGLGTATSSGGVATKNVTGAIAGPITISATAGSLSSERITFSVVAGSADHLSFSNSAGSLASGSTRTLTAE